VKDGNLDEEFTVDPSPHGTKSMKVECIEPHQYKITYEEPVYRNPLADWQAEIQGRSSVGSRIKTFLGLDQ
jgi:hypothetical protein